jgi:hypothetical protein
VGEASHNEVKKYAAEEITLDAKDTKGKAATTKK